ncbi:MAG: AAA family ATPase [Candidatus Komeilibacteria bacterium]
MDKELLIEGQKLVWGKSFSHASVLVDRFRRVVNVIIIAALILAILAGATFFGYNVYSIYESNTDMFTAASWQGEWTHVLWWAVLAAMFLSYWQKSKKVGKYSVLRKGDINRIKKQKYTYINNAFSKDALKVIEKSYFIAAGDGDSAIQPIHIFLSLLQNDSVITIMGRLGVSVKRLSETVASIIKDDGIVTKAGKLNLDANAMEVVMKSYALAYEKQRQQVEVAELLEAIVNVDEKVKELLFDFAITEDKILNAVAWIRIQQTLQERYDRFRYKAGFKPKGSMDKAMTAIATPVLDSFSEDFTMLAKAGYFGLCVARDKEFTDLYSVLEGGGTPVLVGNPGVGVDTIIEGLANRMVAEEVPEFLQDKRMVSLQLSRLVADTTHEGELEGRVMHIINEVSRAGNIVLYINNIHNLVGVSSVGRSNVDLADILTESLIKQGVYVVTSTTPHDYVKYIENSSFANNLTKIEINEPETNQAIQILAANIGRVESKNQVFFTYDALAAAVELSERYMHDRYLPSKAIDIVEEVGVRVKNKRGKNQMVNKEDVAALIAEKAEVPITQVTRDESDKLINIEELIHQRIINQVEAVSAVAGALRRARADLRDLKRPIVNLLFMGPTGVGKTELAKTVAEVYFGDEKKMIRLDMSEYQEKNSLQRLLGTPGGDTGGVLTNAVRQDPHSILLLDEIEKAHPDILNVFLQVMEDGRMTDVTGRTVDFTNLILIMTSNAGTNYIQDQTKAGATAEAIKEALLETELRTSFRPEFLNRFDNIIIFKPLTQEHIEQIALLLLKKETKRLEAKGIFLEATDIAVKELAALGYDPKFGARPLRRVIQEKVENALANFLLTGKIDRRDKVVLETADKIRVDKASRI